MKHPFGNAEIRIEKYAILHSLSATGDLGAGYDGIVVSTSNRTALKSFRFDKLYLRERDVYLRLFEHQIFEACGCRIPRLIDYDDQLWIIEMGIVQPPFILDFAGAYLDERPDYPEDVYAAWIEEKIEQYEDDWPVVQTIMSTLAGYGIYLADVKPGNISVR